MWIQFDKYLIFVEQKEFKTQATFIGGNMKTGLDQCKQIFSTAFRCCWMASSAQSTCFTFTYDGHKDVRSDIDRGRGYLLTRINKTQEILGFSVPGLPSPHSLGDLQDQICRIFHINVGFCGKLHFVSPVIDATNPPKLLILLHTSLKTDMLYFT